MPEAEQHELGPGITLGLGPGSPGDAEFFGAARAGHSGPDGMMIATTMIMTKTTRSRGNRRSLKQLAHLNGWWQAPVFAYTNREEGVS